MDWKLYVPAMPPRSGVEYLVQCVGTHSRERFTSIAEFEPINFNWHTPLDKYPLVVTHYVEITGVKEFEDEHNVRAMVEANTGKAKAKADAKTAAAAAAQAQAAQAQIAASLAQTHVKTGCATPPNSSTYYTGFATPWYGVASNNCFDTNKGLKDSGC